MPHGFQRACRALPSALSFLWLAACAAEAPAPAAAVAAPAEAAAVAPAEPAEAVPSSPPVEPEVALATFDDVWTTVRDRHFDPNLNGVDWDAVRDELRPRAAQAATQRDLEQVLGEMLARLDQSHFAVLPRSMLPPLDAGEDAGEEGAQGSDEDGDLGFDVRLRQGELLVTAVTAGGPASAAGVRPGWVLTRIDDTDLRPHIEEIENVQDPKARRYASFEAHGLVEKRLLGPVGSDVACAFEDQDGRATELTLQRTKRNAVAHTFGPNLPTFYLTFESDVLERGGKRVGWIHFTNWFMPMMEPFNQAIDRMRGCDGIVLDMRGNTGGFAGMIMGVSGHFFAERTHLGTMTGRDGEMTFMAMPQKLSTAGERVEPFGGPVAILTDDMTGSASECFAGGMQSVGRVKVFGETSAGAVLPATTKTLPNGDSLLYAIGDFKTATGELLEGRGVVPDVPVALTREALLKEGDPALEAAVDWITGLRTE